MSCITHPLSQGKLHNYHLHTKLGTLNIVTYEIHNVLRNYGSYKRFNKFYRLTQQVICIDIVQQNQQVKKKFSEIWLVEEVMAVTYTLTYYF